MSATMTAPMVGAPTMLRESVEELVTSALPLARHLASEFLSRAPRHTDRDEILSAAFLGLVEAANAFDPTSGTPFARWAPIRVRGAILDSARSSDVLSRRTRAATKSVSAAREALAQERGGHVDDVAVAARLGWDVSTVRSTREDFARAVTTSLDAVIPDGSGEVYAARLIDADPSPLEQLERAELDRYVADGVQALPERLRDVLESYYLRSEASTDTAARLGVTVQRVGQLRREALEMLRGGVSAQYTPPPPAPPAASVGAPAPGAVRRHAALASYSAAISASSTYQQRVSL